jgi:hypothetical protein
MLGPPPLDLLKLGLVTSNSRVRDVISAAADPEGHGPAPPVSELAAGSHNGRPRAIRDRLDPDDYQRLLAAARAGYCKRALAAEYGISRRSIYRLLDA